MNLDIQQMEGRCRLRLRVSPGAAANRVLGVQAGALKLAIAAPPEKGKANKELIRYLSRLLDVPKSDFELARGDTARDKALDWFGILADEALIRLSALLPV